MDYTITELIADLKSRINAPTSDQAQNQARYIRILNKALQEEIVPLIMYGLGDFFLRMDSLSPSNGEIIIPQRAIGAHIKNINGVNGSTAKFRLRLIDSGDLDGKTGFYFKNDRVVFYPSGNYPGPYEIWYYRRPGFLVDVTSCGQVTNIASNVVTCSTVPSSWTTSTVVDMIANRPHFYSLADDQAISAITPGTNGTITFSSVPSDLAVGDYICPQYHSCIAQIPLEFHGLLALKAALRVLLSMGATQQYQLVKGEVEELSKSMQGMIDPRADNEAVKITNPNWYRNLGNYPIR